MAKGTPYCWLIAISAGINANEDPKNAGTFAPVTRIYNKVPEPAVNNAVDVLSPVKSGTRIVAPNIANTC